MHVVWRCLRDDGEDDVDNGDETCGKVVYAAEDDEEAKIELEKGADGSKESGKRKQARESRTFLVPRFPGALTFASVWLQWRRHRHLQIQSHPSQPSPVCSTNNVYFCCQ